MLTLWAGACAATAAPAARLRLAWWHIGRGAASPEHGQPVRQAPHRAPPSCAPVKGEGDRWGDLQAMGREAGALLRLLKPTQKQTPTPRPPSRAGARKPKQKDQFLAARVGL